MLSKFLALFHYCAENSVYMYVCVCVCVCVAALAAGPRAAALVLVVVDVVKPEVNDAMTHHAL